MSDIPKPSWIVRIPTPIWLIGLVAIALIAEWVFMIPVFLQYKPAGVVLVVLGFLCSASGRLTFKKRSAEIFPWSETHSTLVTTGPFRFTRNPMYLGLVTIGLGAALLAGTWLMWLVPVAIFVLDNFIIIPFEEKSMERAYGDAYRAYKALVRRWI
jgi:protein-S-isoprenylcysteine O-methyltransferase Ste14